MPDSRPVQLLLTGATGSLGTALRAEAASRPDLNLLTPSRVELDLCDSGSITSYFQNHRIDAVIHTAAMARLRQCEEEPAAALDVNTGGTARLVSAVLAQSRPARFVHVSTDGVYPSTDGGYTEDSPVGPSNRYGWSKLGAECAVSCLRDYCIVRTRFFDPGTFRFDDAAEDLFSSMIPVGEVAEALLWLVGSSYSGVLNVGGPRGSDFDLLRKHLPGLKPCRRAEFAEASEHTLATDASMDVSRWQALRANS